ncbi:MAG: autotransporter-associated beta strand repeat-containing protein [Kiritimatiellae bacterium]|nr:autotransporter-associated beta strand repeat-containing protein [Kiritimatiellia bacterium]
MTSVTVEGAEGTYRLKKTPTAVLLVAIAAENVLDTFTIDASTATTWSAVVNDLLAKNQVLADDCAVTIDFGSGNTPGSFTFDNTSAVALTSLTVTGSAGGVITASTGNLTVTTYTRDASCINLTMDTKIFNTLYMGAQTLDGWTLGITVPVDTEATLSNVFTVASGATLKKVGAGTLVLSSKNVFNEGSAFQVLEGTAKLNAQKESLAANILIAADATLVMTRNEDLIRYAATNTIDVYGTLDLQETRWTLKSNNVINLYPGAQVVGLGQEQDASNRYGALDWATAGTINVKPNGEATGTAMVSANLRMRASVTVNIEDGMTVVFSGTVSADNSGQTLTKAGAGTMEYNITANPHSVAVSAGVLTGTGVIGGSLSFVEGSTFRLADAENLMTVTGEVSGTAALEVADWATVSGDEVTWFLKTAETASEPTFTVPEGHEIYTTIVGEEKYFGVVKSVYTSIVTEVTVDTIASAAPWTTEYGKTITPDWAQVTKVTLNYTAEQTFTFDATHIITDLILMGTTAGTVDVTGNATLTVTNTAVQTDVTAEKGVTSLGAVTVAETATLTMVNSIDAINSIVNNGALRLTADVAGQTFDISRRNALKRASGKLLLAGEQPITVIVGKSGADAGEVAMRTIVEEGNHTAQFYQTSNTTYTNTATDDDPAIWVKPGASLVMKARDITGWAGEHNSGMVIRNGGSLIWEDVDGTDCYTGRWTFDDGARMEISSANATRLRFAWRSGSAENPNVRLISGTAEIAKATTTTSGVTATSGLNLYNGSTLFVETGAAATDRLVISAPMVQYEGTSAVTKTGAGVLQLTGVNTYAGATTVSSGRLEIDGSVTSAVTVANGASVGGTGTITGDLTLNDGASIVVTSATHPLTVTGAISETVVFTLADGVTLSEVAATPLLTLPNTTEESGRPTTITLPTEGFNTVWSGTTLYALKEGLTLSDVTSVKATIDTTSNWTALTWTDSEGTEVTPDWRTVTTAEITVAATATLTLDVALPALTSVSLVPNVADATLTLAGSAELPTTTVTDQNALTLATDEDASWTMTSLISNASLTADAAVLNKVGTVTMAADTTLTPSGRVTAVIAGEGAVSAVQNPILAAANTYTGVTYLPAGATLTLENANAVASTAQFCGATASDPAAGKLICKGALPVVTATTLFTDSTKWAGTVKLQDVLGSGNKLLLNEYGSATTVVELENVEGWINTGTTIPNLQLTGKGLLLKNGSSTTAQTVTINRLFGSGDFRGCANSKSWMYNITVDALGNEDGSIPFTGAIDLSATLSNQTVVSIGATAASVDTGKIVIAKAVTIPAEKTWSAINGISVTATGVLSGSGTLAGATTFAEGATVSVTDFDNLLTIDGAVSGTAAITLPAETEMPTGGTRLAVLKTTDATSSLTMTYGDGSAYIVIAEANNEGGLTYSLIEKPSYTALTATVSADANWSALTWKDGETVITNPIWNVVTAVTLNAEASATVAVDTALASGISVTVNGDMTLAGGSATLPAGALTVSNTTAGVTLTNVYAATSNVAISGSGTVVWATTGTHSGAITTAVDTTLKTTVDATLSSTSNVLNGSLTVESGTLVLAVADRGLKGNTLVAQGATLATTTNDAINYNGTQTITINGTVQVGNKWTIFDTNTIVLGAGAVLESYNNYTQPLDIYGSTNNETNCPIVVNGANATIRAKMFNHDSLTRCSVVITFAEGASLTIEGDVAAIPVTTELASGATSATLTLTGTKSSTSMLTIGNGIMLAGDGMWSGPATFGGGNTIHVTNPAQPITIVGAVTVTEPIDVIYDANATLPVQVLTSSNALTAEILAPRAGTSRTVVETTETDGEGNPTGTAYTLCYDEPNDNNVTMLTADITADATWTGLPWTNFESSNTVDLNAVTAENITDIILNVSETATLTLGDVKTAFPNALVTINYTAADKTLTLSGDAVVLANVEMTGETGVLLSTATALTMDSLTLPMDAGIGVSVFNGVTTLIAPSSYALYGDGTLAKTLPASGTVHLAGGTIKQNAANCLTQTNTIIVNAGATLDLNGFAHEASLTLNGGILTNSGGVVGTGLMQQLNLTLTADSEVAVSSGFEFYSINSAYNHHTLTLNGHTLTKTGTGTFGLYNASVSTGTVTVVGGEISFTGNAHTCTLTDVTLEENGGEITFSHNYALSGTNTLKGDIAIGSALSGDGALTVATGTTTLSGANTYTGTTTIVDGATLKVTTVEALGASRTNGTLALGSTTLAGNGTLELAFADIATSVNMTGNGGTFTGDILVSGGTLTFPNGSGGNGPIHGRTITVTGANAALATGTNTDATGWNVAEGQKLVLNDGAEFKVYKRDTLKTPVEMTGGIIRLMAGCADGGRGLDWFENPTLTVKALEDATAEQPTDSYITVADDETGDSMKMMIRHNTATGVFPVEVKANARLTVDAHLYGGTITKTGEGELVLTNASNEYGATEINAGTLTVTGSTGTGVTTMAAGTTLRGTGTVKGDLTFMNTTETINDVDTITSWPTFEITEATAMTVNGSITGVAQLSVAESLLDLDSIPVVTTSSTTPSGENFTGVPDGFELLVVGNTLVLTKPGNVYGTLYATVTEDGANWSDLTWTTDAEGSSVATDIVWGAVETITLTADSDYLVMRDVATPALTTLNLNGTGSIALMGEVFPTTLSTMAVNCATVNLFEGILPTIPQNLSGGGTMNFLGGKITSTHGGSGAETYAYNNFTGRWVLLPGHTTFATMTISGTGAQKGQLNWDANVAGSGQIEVTSGTRLVLSGQNVFGWGQVNALHERTVLVVDGGTVEISTLENYIRRRVELKNNATLELPENNGSVYFARGAEIAITEGTANITGVLKLSCDSAGNSVGKGATISISEGAVANISATIAHGQHDHQFPLTFTGGGKAILTGANTYETYNATVVDAGTTLVMNGSHIAPDNTSIKDYTVSGKLGGTGTIGGNVTLAEGASLFMQDPADALEIRGAVTPTSVFVEATEAQVVAEVTVFTATADFDLAQFSTYPEFTLSKAELTTTDGEGNTTDTGYALKIAPNAIQLTGIETLPNDTKRIVQDIAYEALTGADPGEYAVTFVVETMGQQQDADEDTVSGLLGCFVDIAETTVDADADTVTINIAYEFGLADVTVDANLNVIFKATVEGANVAADYADGVTFDIIDTISGTTWTIDEGNVVAPQDEIGAVYLTLPDAYIDANGDDASVLTNFIGTRKFKVKVRK